MLIFEDEIRYLPHFHVDGCNGLGVAFLWQHEQTERSLLDYARIHYPLTAWGNFANLKGKRLKERLSVEMLVKQLLGQRAELAHEQSGKPFVNIGGIEISVSHSYNIYGVSLSLLRHGMDIEQWGNKAWRVHEKFLSAEEEAMLSAFAPQLTKEQAATLFWSAKEAVFKAYDQPVPDFKNGILLRPSETKPHFLHATLPQLGEETNVEYALYPTCIQTLCIQNGQKSTKDVQFPLK